MGNKTVLTSEELRGIYDILISDEPKVVDTCPPALSTNTFISENTSASYGTDGPRQEVASKRNSVSRLDEELLSVLVDLKNDDSKEDFEIGNSAAITDEGRLTSSFYSKTVFNLSQTALSDIEI